MEYDMKRGFASDNNAGAHPAVLAALQDVNSGHMVGYGDDPITSKAVETIQSHFGAEAQVFFCYNGTGANILSLGALTRSYHSILCAETAHIQVDECGAPEKFTNCKVIPIPTQNGKLTPELLENHMHGFGFEHHSQPGIISITQTTELGTVYRPAEIQALADFAHEYCLKLHMDGARLSNAAAFLDLPLRALTTDCGVDVLSLGLTKNGGIFGEAVVFLNTSAPDDFKYFRKQAAQLHSKMRFISAQYNALLSNEVWLKNARHANSMAQLLYSEVAQLPGISITQPVESNGVFAIVPPHIIQPLMADFFFYMWDEHNHEVRWMTAFDTTEDDIHRFIARIKELL
jgi:threonine aldolase